MNCTAHCLTDVSVQHPPTTTRSQFKYMGTLGDHAARRSIAGFSRYWIGPPVSGKNTGSKVIYQGCFGPSAVVAVSISESAKVRRQEYFAKVSSSSELKLLLSNRTPEISLYDYHCPDQDRRPFTAEGRPYAVLPIVWEHSGTGWSVSEMWLCLTMTEALVLRRSSCAPGAIRCRGVVNAHEGDQMKYASVVAHTGRRSPIQWYV